MAAGTDGVPENLKRINGLLTQLQYSRVEAQELTNEDLRQHLTDFLTQAIGELRKGQEEARVRLLRSMIANDVCLDDPEHTVTAPISALA